MENPALNPLHKIIPLILLLTLSVFTVKAQKSPADSVSKIVEGVDVTIRYHSPRVRERIIWGLLVPYDKVWRTGANNATTIEVSGDLKIESTKLPKGKYALFTIPKTGGSWTVIINKVPDQWGAFSYNEKEDLMRFEVPVEKIIDKSEELKFDIDNDGNVVFKWEYLSFRFPLNK